MLNELLSFCSFAVWILKLELDASAIQWSSFILIALAGDIVLPGQLQPSGKRRRPWQRRACGEYVCAHR